MSNDPKAPEITIDELTKSVDEIAQTQKASKKTERRRFVVLAIAHLVVAACTAFSLYLHYDEKRRLESQIQRTMRTDLELQILPYSIVKSRMNGNSFEWRDAIVDLPDHLNTTENEAVIVVVNPSDVSTGDGCIRGSLWVPPKPKITLGDMFKTEMAFSPKRGEAYFTGYVYDKDFKSENLRFLKDCKKEQPLVRVKFIPFTPPTTSKPKEG